MLTILIGRAKTGKSDTMLRRMAELGESSQQILLVPEHASHLICSAHAAIPPAVMPRC